MKRTRFLLILCTSALAAGLCVAPGAGTAAPPQEAPANSSELALVGGRIYVSPYKRPINNGVIIIRNGKIAEVGKRDKITVPEGIGILDCSRMYIMAGFQNSHVHFTESKWNDAARLPAGQLTDQLRQMFTKYGFTTVVDLGSMLQNTVTIRGRIDSGDVMGPHILTAGAPLYPPNGVPYYLKGSLPLDILKQLPQPATPEDAVKIVDQNIAGGADVIKLFTGSWAEREKVVTMPLAVAQAAVNEAHKKGKLVFAHPSNVAGLQVAIESHVDVLAHAVEDTRGWNHDYIPQMKAQRLWLIPTLSLFSGDSNFKDILQEVHDYSQDHEQILFGTDVGFISDYDPTNEYVFMHRAGMDFWHILDSLTTAPAIRFGQSSIGGQIRPGMNADLVVVSGDPEHDIRALAHVNFTFRDGRVIYSLTEQ